MEENVYAPPEAELQPDSAGDEAPYFVVVPWKLYTMALLTLGLYYVYWFYKNYRIVQLRTGEGMWPVARGIFYIFFTHSLLRRVDETLKEKGEAFQWDHGMIATLFVIVSIGSNVVGRLSGEGIGMPTTDIIFTITLFVFPAMLLKAQRGINLACGDPEGTANNRLTLANWIWMVIGGLILILVVFGLFITIFMPELVAE